MMRWRSRIIISRIERNRLQSSVRFFMSLAPLVAAAFLAAEACRADAPSVSYIFPAGGQRGTRVTFKVGSHYLYEGCPFYLMGQGVTASPRIERTETIWFEGPLIPMPASQAAENYPRDYVGTIDISPDAELGNRYWTVTTSQGVTPPMKFAIGDDPEIIEKEISGLPIPTEVTPPVVVNGRIFPREDVDIWSVALKQGEALTVEVDSARLGYPLDSFLEIRDPLGLGVAENDDHFGTDSFIKFIAPADGVYQIYLRDVNLGGLQHYVYRLHVSTGPRINRIYPLGGRRGTREPHELIGIQLPENMAEVDLTQVESATVHRYRHPSIGGDVLMPIDDLPELREAEGDTVMPTVTFPAVLNGRIIAAGETDIWTFTSKMGEVWFFDLQAGRWGSPLDSVLTILDEKGAQLATADDIGAGNSDSQLTWTALSDGTFQVAVKDRSSNRGGSDFVYRLKVDVPAKPGFRLTSAIEAINVNRAGEAKWKVDATRSGGFNGEIQLEFDNLPEGISATTTTIPMGQNTVEVVFKAEETARVQMKFIQARGKAMVGDQEMVQPLSLSSARGDEPRTDIPLAVTIPTPFKVVGVFESKFVPRGTTHVRHYRIERGGYDGPLEISLADRQNRHLQGVTGQTIAIPPGIDEFDYEIQLPSWMEIGRTSRTVLMAVGVVKDADGTEHKVSFSSAEQNDQIIAIVEPEILSIEARQPTMRNQPGMTVPVTVRVNRAASLTQPVEVSLRIPDHIRGVRAEPIVLAPDQNSGVLNVQFDADAAGPWNDSLTLLATTSDERGLKVTAESPLMVVPAE